MSTPENRAQGPQPRPEVDAMDPLEQQNVVLTARVAELEGQNAQLHETLEFMRSEVARELLSVAESLSQSAERITALAEMMGSITTESPRGTRQPGVVRDQPQAQPRVDDTRIREPLPPAANPGHNGNKQERRGRRWLTAAVAVGALAVGVAAGFLLDKDDNGKVKNQATEQVANKNTKNAALAALAANRGSETVNAFAAGELAGTMQDGVDQQEAAAAAAAKERAQARAEARVAMISNVKDAKTVPFAAKRLISTPDTVNSNVRWIHNNNVEKQLLHPRGEMSSIDEAFNPHTLNNTNAKELLAFSFEGSTGYAMASYQAAHGGAKTSPEAAQAWLNKTLASAEGNVRVSDALKGQVRMNHGQRGENVFAAGEFKIKGPVVLFDTGDVTLVYKLDNNGCLNLLTKAPSKSTTGTPSMIPSNPTNPSNPSNPRTHSGPTSGHGNGEGTPTGGHKLHKPATGPPKEAEQAPRQQPATEGYTRGNAEDVVSKQNGDPTNLDPTEKGTRIPEGQPAPGGGDKSVVAQPPNKNDQYTGGESQGSSNDIKNNPTGSESQTQGSGQTSGAASDPGAPN